jgi:hypothetical protein
MGKGANMLQIALNAQVLEVADRYVQVHRDGSIWRAIKYGAWERMKPYRMNTGHMCVYIRGNRVVSRLVAEAFIPNPYNYRYVGHIDGNLENNSADNLYWCTFGCIRRVALARHKHILCETKHSPLMEMLAEYNMA